MRRQPTGRDGFRTHFQPADLSQTVELESAKQLYMTPATPAIDSMSYGTYKCSEAPTAWDNLTGGSHHEQVKLTPTVALANSGQGRKDGDQQHSVKKANSFRQKLKN